MSYIKKKTKNTEEYKPINEDKYVGEYPLIMRSSWETKFAYWLDHNPNVIWWMSEPNLNLKYQDITSSDKTGKPKIRTYYPDFLFKAKDQNNKKQIYLIEVKPYKEIFPPISKKGKKRQNLLREQKTWKVNNAKWKTAERYCNLKGWQFKLVTEKELFRK